MKLETQVIECKVEKIKLAIGSGNHLFLFRGDRINVSIKPSAHNQHRVVDSHGCIIGYITSTEIHWITNQPMRKGRGKQNALATQ